MTYSNIATEVEHLDLFRETFLTTSRFYPSDYFTVLLSAMVGASRAFGFLRHLSGASARVVHFQLSPKTVASSGGE
jgi:hypothetical protein